MEETMQVTEQDWPTAQLKLQCEVLEKTARQLPLQDILDSLCVLVQDMVSDTVCTVLLLNEQGRLDVFAAPSLLNNAEALLAGLKPSKYGGSCCAAVQTGEAVIVENTAIDERWRDVRNLADELQIKACWSIPIKVDENKIVGTFAISHGVVRRPSSQQEMLLETARHLAGIAIQRDTSDKTRTRLEDELRQAHKLEAVGTLASGIAHDFNNTLTAIMGYAEMLEREESIVETARLAIDGITDLSHQAMGVTRSLLTFAGRQSGQKEPTNVASIVESSLGMIRPIMPASIEFMVDDTTDTDLWIHADPSLIQQVLINLAVNARDAMPNGGKLRIEISWTRATPTKAPLPPTSRGYAVLKVRDDGSGIAPDALDRVFEPFFTTKTRGRGTGLGMSVTHGIVRELGGTIEIESGASRGTTVSVTIPCCEAVDENARSVTEHCTMPAATTGTILIAEDRSEILELMSGAFRSAGFVVVQAADGAQAIEQFDANRENVDMTILDFDLPKRDGLRCLAHLRESHPELPAIIITGRQDIEQRDMVGPTHLLYKPFRPRQLVALAAQILGTATST